MVYIVYTDYHQNPDEEVYARANDMVEARKLAVRILEGNRRPVYTVYIAQVDRYNNDVYPWHNLNRSRIVGKVGAVNYGKHFYQVWVPQNGKKNNQKVMYRDGDLYMTLKQFEEFMEFHIEESLEF